MAIVTFYRRGKKETGQTLSMAAIATNIDVYKRQVQIYYIKF